MGKQWFLEVFFVYLRLLFVAGITLTTKGVKSPWDNPQWCNIERPSNWSTVSEVCDPDGAVSFEDRQNLRLQLSVCEREVAKIFGRDVAIVIVLASKIQLSQEMERLYSRTAQAETTVKADLLLNETVLSFNLTSKPAVIVVAISEGRQIREWLSEPLRGFAGPSKRGDSVASRVGKHFPDFDTEVGMVAGAICNVTKSLVRRPFAMHPKLIVAISLVVFVGCVILAIVICVVVIRRNAPDRQPEYSAYSVELSCGGIPLELSDLNPSGLRTTNHVLLGTSDITAIAKSPPSSPPAVDNQHASSTSNLLN